MLEDRCNKIIMINVLLNPIVLFPNIHEKNISFVFNDMAETIDVA